VVVGVADEELVRLAEVLVEPYLEQVLVDRLVEREAVGREAAAEVRAVRQRELVEVRPHVGAHGHRDRAAARGGQDPLARGLVRNDRRDGLAEPLAQALVAEEEEALVLAQRPRERGAELVAAEVGLLVGIEEVAGVERVVAVVLVEAAVPGVLARLRDHVDLAAGVAAELGRVGVGLDAELAHRLGAERRARRAARRAVREVVQQRAVEQVHVRARVLAVDAGREAVRHDRAAVAVREAQHPGLQEHEVGVVAPVERQVGDRLLAHEVAELAAPRLDAGDAARHRDLVRGSELQREREHGRLAQHHRDPALQERAEARERGPHLVGPDGHRGQHELAAGSALGLADEAGLEMPRAHAHPGQRRARGVARPAGDRGRGGLCGRDGPEQEQQPAGGKRTARTRRRHAQPARRTS
jgi:hypothetical protein